MNLGIIEFKPLILIGISLKSNENRVLIIFWSFLSIFLIFCFASDLTALEASQHPIRIENFQKLYENPEIKLMVVRNSNIKRMIEKQHNVLSHRLLNVSHNELFNKRTVIRLINENKVLIESHQKVGVIIKHFNEFNLIQSNDETASTNLLGFPLRRTVDQKFKVVFSKL